MKNLNIDIELLKTLFIHTRFAYKGLSFNEWVKECQKSYKSYLNRAKNPKTYEQWVNGQILALAY